MKSTLKLLVITEPKLKPNVVKSVEEGFEGEATSTQLRMKDASARQIFEVGLEIRRLTRDYGALYSVDDRLDVALATNVDGVQLEPEYMPIDIAKEIALNMLIGASICSLREAVESEKLGGHFLGTGSVNPSPTKPNVPVIGLEGLRLIVKSVEIPVIAIGNTTESKVLEVMETGVVGVAVISAVMGAPSVRKATAKLGRLVDKAYATRRAL
ncbi:MAG: thiamine phosphate synthase [Thermosphaera aggregans]|uniref:thiamine phosphate synthase n=1 Tax=Thermosphaera aggregans TaxID=54254 RepID=UPI003C00F4B5